MKRFVLFALVLLAPICAQAQFEEDPSDWFCAGRTLASANQSAANFAVDDATMSEAPGWKAYSTVIEELVPRREIVVTVHLSMDSQRRYVDYTFKYRRAKEAGCTGFELMIPQISSSEDEKVDQVQKELRDFIQDLGK